MKSSTALQPWEEHEEPRHDTCVELWSSPGISGLALSAPGAGPRKLCAIALVDLRNLQLQDTALLGSQSAGERKPAATIMGWRETSS